MRYIPLLAFIAASLLPGAALAETLFDTQTAAQLHCPSDDVVWLNTRSDVYHFEGGRWYGRTENGAYVCRREADAAGDRPSKNG